MNKLAPIVLFCYNRPWHTEQTLNALMNNDLASESELYIYSDGPKPDANSEDITKIQEVRKVIRMHNWCKEVHIIESDKNKGLANSIIEGVTKIVNDDGNVIVLEDDIVTSKGFLAYMNDALTFYKNEEKVMHISGFMFPHTKKLPETFFYNVPMCWGWATWDRAWLNFNGDAGYWYQYYSNLNNWEEYNKLGGKYLQKQLKANVDLTLHTWFIKWHSSTFSRNGYTLFPGVSLVKNIGLDNSGVHSGIHTKYDSLILTDSISVEKIEIKESSLARREIITFYQGKNYYIKRAIIKLTPEWIKPFFKNLFKL